MRTAPDSRRTQHLSALRDALWQFRRATRAQLSEATGLSAMTVGKLLAELQARGEVRQDEQDAATGGRPSTLAIYNADYAHIAVISVEQSAAGNDFTMSLFNLFGERVYTMHRIIADVREDSFDIFLQRAQAEGFAVRMVAFALPGEAEGDCLFLSDFEGLLYDRFLPRIRRLFGVETLFENDINAAVLGHDFGSDAGEVAAGVYFPRRFGPGGGAVVRGELVHGRCNFAGEVGFVRGRTAWETLNYADTERVMAMISEVLVIYACVLAPQAMVLYGDFLTPEMTSQLSARVQAHLPGRMGMRLTCETSLVADMERGALILAQRRMRAWFAAQDAAPKPRVR